MAMSAKGSRLTSFPPPNPSSPLRGTPVTFTIARIKSGRTSPVLQTSADVIYQNGATDMCYIIRRRRKFRLSDGHKGGHGYA